MGNCPVCNARVAEDFGLVECPSCGAQLIVHVDGRVEYSGGQESNGPQEGEGGPLPELPDPPEPEALPDLPEEAIVEFDPIDPEAENEPPAEPPEPENLPPELGGEVAAEQMFDGSEPDHVGEAPAVYQPVKPPDSPDLSDLAQFANSPDSGGREGPLRYHLQVSGIDTADVRDAFREAITDRKFMWDTDQILRSIRHGEVNIDNVPPAKAYMLIIRLRNLPVRVKWEQHAVTQP